MNRAIAGAALIMLISGCATTPDGSASRDEWEAIHVRTYDDVSPREVQDAAEKVLRLADKDFTFEYPEGRLQGNRKWTVYAVIAIVGGTDYWTVETRSDGAGTKATLQITRQASGTTAMPVIGGPGVTAMTTATPGYPIFQKAPHMLFWQRMEYMLGKRSDWPTCDSFKDIIKTTIKRTERNQLEVLCSVNTDDKSPGAN